MLNLDTRIPLMAQERDYGRGFDMMQKAQENQLRLQALRDEYNAAKEERDRQKAMRQGVASELQKMQQGTPAQYRTTFPQTMPTGQMPKGMTGVLASGGMTGVLASERGQKLPQPALFGENILQGNFDVNRELVAPAVEGREPTYLEQLQIAAKQALKAGDVDSAFKFSQAMQQQRIAEREQNAPVGNPYPVYDTSGNFVGTRIMTKSGQEIPFGQQGTTTVKPDVLSAKDKAEIEFQERKFRAEQAQKQKEYDLDYKKYIADLNKPDPVEKALTLADARIDAKIKQEMVNDATVFTRDYSTVKPIIKQAQLAVKNLPPDMIQTYLQSKLSGTPLNKYFGNPEQQLAIRNLDMVMENIRLLAEKPVGNLTMGEQQIVGKSVGIITDLNSSKEQKIDAVNTLANIYEAKEAMHKNVLKKFGKEDFNLFTETSKYTLSATPEQKQQYEDAIKRANGNQEQIKQINFIAKKQGVIK